MSEKKITFDKDAFVPWRTAPRKVGRTNNKYANARLSKYSKKNDTVYYSLAVSAQCKNLLTYSRYLPKIGKEVLALYPDEHNGYAMSPNGGGSHRIQFMVDEEMEMFLAPKCGEYKLKNDRGVLYIVFRERVDAKNSLEEDDVPLPEELPIPAETPSKRSSKKIDLVVAPPIGRQYIGDKNVLKLLDEIDRKGYVSIRDADRLGIKNYPNAVKALTITYGYATVSVPVVSEKNRVVFVTTLYNGDGEWKE